MAVQYFVAADYCVLVVVLGISSAIGVFFAWKDRRSTNNKEFLIGNRKLQLFPVTMSMIASFLSAIAMLGVPAENFVHGSQYLMNTVGVVVGIVLSAEVFMPVFYDMEMISVNQYLEKRFNSVVLRKFASALSIIQTCFYLGVVLYGPSLALGSVTGLPVWLSIIVNGSVCAFYTTIGGIKAVVWTDVMQLLLMVTGFLVVTIQACMMLGGVSPVFTIADQQGILEFFDFSFDLQKTFTFWSVVIGSSVIWTMTFCTNQTMVQRYCGLSSASKARKALYTNMAGVSALLTLASFCGLALFALYHKCDPVKARIITKYDQLMPHFVMDTLNHLPGLSGLFVTAVYSGSLSTMSSGYNALAAITWEDFLKPILHLSPSGVMRATKIIAASYGVLAILVAFLSGTIPSILQATFITSGAVGGASGAVFFIGLLLPWCGSKTALASMITGMCTASWVAIGSLIYPKRPVAAHTSLEGCAFNYTLQATDPVEYRSGGIFELYHISYFWVPVISFFVTMILAVAITAALGFKNSADVDPSLIAPGLRNFYLRTRPSTTLSDSKSTVKLTEKEEWAVEKQPESIKNGHINYGMTNDSEAQSTPM
ncbi:sodium-coupled monocarboxylate transporter 1 [Ixodes scapularis]|uniref:sodium-coupled monocarboxylate transporter 1 n=1 Tax=Ixodes scapularis TaxID=6945 RepID=UPI001A9DDCD5|nr:sodium-coupled monocarboxylate transporter 1 [Ixodes scapularis]